MWQTIIVLSVIGISTACGDSALGPADGTPFLRSSGPFNR